MSDRTAAAQRFYGRWARLYDLVARRTPGIGDLRGGVADALDLSRGETAVEMGTGTGANLPYLAERVGPEGTVVGVDVTEGVLRRARAAEGNRPGVHLVRGDATRPPIDDADAVLGTFVVGMFDDPAAAVDRWCDLVGSGGRVALMDAARSERAYGPLVNAPFLALVIASTPSRRAFLGSEPPWSLLDRRVAMARDALARRATIEIHEERVAGVVRITAGRVE